MPSPRAPVALDPQQSTVPEVRIAQELPPLLTTLVAEIPTGAGDVLHGAHPPQLSGPVLEPSPSSP